MKNLIIVSVFLFVALGGASALKIYSIISEPTFLSLIIVIFLIGLFISYSDKVKSINLAKGELILRDMQETEASVKELAKAILEVTEASNHGLMLQSYDGKAHELAIEKLRKLTA